MGFSTGNLNDGYFQWHGHLTACQWDTHYQNGRDPVSVHNPYIAHSKNSPGSVARLSILCSTPGEHVSWCTHSQIVVLTTSYMHDMTQPLHTTWVVKCTQKLYIPVMCIAVKPYLTGNLWGFFLNTCNIHKYLYIVYLCVLFCWGN